MIKKLSQRIFMLIMASLSILILGIILLFAFFNYKNTINSRVSMIERFGMQDIKKGINEKPQEIKEPEINIDGIYNITVENSKIIQISNISQEKNIEDYAIKLSKKNDESGIIGDYFYRIRKTKEGRVHITLMEDTSAVLNIKQSIVFSGLLCVISIIIIYSIAKKVSKIIVRPVEETFEKQKQFISDASHELKTPLAVIEANTDVIENEIGNNKWLTYIQNEIQSMNKLINELLLLAKMENTDNIKDYKEFNLSEETELIVSMFESMAYEKNIKLNTNIDENILLNGNKEDIEHILSTLIDNAIKHTDKEKEIIVDLKKEKDNIIMQVKNIGQPIPKEEREKIFERFYRIDKARNRNEKRYGLGLAIAKSTVEKYNGSIDVDYKDGFTIFKVKLSQKV